MHAFQTAASAFCIACICAEITTLLAGAGWAGRCIKAVAGLSRRSTSRVSCVTKDYRPQQLVDIV